MSRRRRHVRDLASDDVVELDDDDVVCVAVANLGSNLLDVERGDDGTRAIVRVPNKFKDLARFRKGTHVVAAFAEAATREGERVTGEVRRVLYETQRKELRKRNDGSWPERFEERDVIGEGDADAGDGCALGRELRKALNDAEAEDNEAAAVRDDDGDDDDDDDDDDDLPPISVNQNRRRVVTYVDSDESDSDSDSD